MAQFYQLPITVTIGTATLHTSLVVCKSDTVERVLAHVHYKYDLPLDKLSVPGHKSMECLDVFSNGINVVFGEEDNSIAVEIRWGGNKSHLINFPSDYTISDAMLVIRGLLNIPECWSPYYNGCRLTDDDTLDNIFNNDNNPYIRMCRRTKAVNVRYVDKEGEEIVTMTLSMCCNSTIDEIKKVTQLPSHPGSILYIYKGVSGYTGSELFMNDLIGTSMCDMLTCVIIN